MTKEERRLWYGYLRDHHVKFYKQKIIRPYIVDFFCSAAKLAVELDGSQHYDPQGQAYDVRRTAYLEEQGILVLRFSNTDVLRRMEGVCEQIDEMIKHRLNCTASKASPHNCVCGLRPIFCPIRAVIKGGNTYSIPALL